jgi:hypothetical protein
MMDAPKDLVARFHAIINETVRTARGIKSENVVRKLTLETYTARHQLWRGS